MTTPITAQATIQRLRIQSYRVLHAVRLETLSRGNTTWVVAGGSGAAED